MSEARRKGTVWESAVRDFLSDNGFPYCERMALGGIRDRGDLTGIPGWLMECKNTRTISLGDWLTIAEHKAARLDVDPVLFVKRRMRGVGAGYAVTRIETWAKRVQ